jgi:chemosensory pili system protein ChpA (sensor histidine kinase/response regulator)
LTALLEPIETHLENQERIITEEVERRRAAKETAEKARLQARIDTLQKFGAKVDVEMIRGLSDAEFSEEVAIAKDEWQTAEDRRKAEEAETMKRAAEQEKARKLLEAERAAAEEAKREADAARAKAERAIRDAQEAERAAAAKIKAEKEKAEAVERARIAEAERIKRETEEKERAAAEAAKAEAERVAREEAQRPVRAKILAIADAIEEETIRIVADSDDALLLSARRMVVDLLARLRQLAAK